MRGKPRPRACQDCGAVFMARSGAQKRCPTCQRKAVLACKRRNSLRYYYEHRRKVPTGEIVCACCGKKFMPRSGKQKKYCSELCANRDAGARWRRRNGVKARGAAARVGPVVGPVEDSKRTTTRDWMAQVEMDLRIADPTERFEASRAWSARQRAYARKCALRALGWRGCAY